MTCHAVELFGGSRRPRTWPPVKRCPSAGDEPRPAGGSRSHRPTPAPRRARHVVVALAVIASAENASAHLRRIGESLRRPPRCERRGRRRRGDRGHARRARFEQPPAPLGDLVSTPPDDRRAWSGERDVHSRRSPPPLRYASGQVAIVLVVRDGAGGDGWRAVQGTGAGLVLSDGALSEEVERSLAELWSAARSIPSEAPAGALARLLEGAPAEARPDGRARPRGPGARGTPPRERRERAPHPPRGSRARARAATGARARAREPGLREPPPRATAPRRRPRPGSVGGELALRQRLAPVESRRALLEERRNPLAPVRAPRGIGDLARLRFHLRLGGGRRPTGAAIA